MTRATQIVVGWDASPDAHAALTWAIREASSQRWGIRAVFCEPDLRAWDGAATAMSGAPVLGPTVAHAGEQIVGEAATIVKAAGVPVEVVNTYGSIAAELVQQSRSARMLVLGARGHGALSSAILGSTVAHVASHAHCPVIVTRSDTVTEGPIVVGVDGSVESEYVVGWAMDLASRHRRAVEVLHAYSIPLYPGVVPYVPPAEVTRSTREMERRIAAETLAGWRERYPDVEVTMSVRLGRPAPMLVAATERASLTVVGSRGRGAFLGMLLGSTSQSLLQHAAGSVAVLRHPDEEPPASA